MRIIHFDIDTLRPDHLGCYGYGRPTSPTIDRIAHEGVVFRDAYAAATPCVPSRASLMSGRPAVHTGVVTHWGVGSTFNAPWDGDTYDADDGLLPRLLQQSGHRTASFSSFPSRHFSYWFHDGWDETSSYGLNRGHEDAADVNQQVLPWLRRVGHDQDFFLHVHYWDPHRPFTVDEAEVSRFAAAGPVDWPGEAEIREHQEMAGPFTASELHPLGYPSSSHQMPQQIANRDDLARLVAGYDASIARVDQHIQQVLEVLDELGILDDTAIIISSDHGEALGEHGVYADHVCAGEEIHHIPMIVRWPGADPQEVNGFVYHYDLSATILDLLGLDIPRQWQARSFADVLHGDPFDFRDHLVWDHGLYTCQRAVRSHDWLYIRTFHPGLFDFPPESLYHVREDPHCQYDLADERPAVLTEHRALLESWERDQSPDGIALTAASDPLRAVAEQGPFRTVQAQDWLNHLRSRDRAAAADEIARRLDEVAARHGTVGAVAPGGDR